MLSNIFHRSEKNKKPQTDSELNSIASDDREATLYCLERAENEIWQGIKAEKSQNWDLAAVCYRRALESDPKCIKAYQLLGKVLKKVSTRQAKTAGINSPITNFDSPQVVKGAIYSSIFQSQTPSLQGVAQGDWNRSAALSDGHNSERGLIPSAFSQSSAEDLLSKSSINNFSHSNPMPVDTNLNANNHSSASDNSDRDLVLLPNMKLSPGGEMVLQDNLTVARVYVEQGLAFYEQKEWQKGIAACQEALRLCPSLGEAYKVWGNCLQQSGNSADAIGIYAKALELQPNMAEIYCNLGSIYARGKKWQQAIEYYQKSIVIDPQCVASHRNLAKVWDRLKEYDKSEACFFKALALDPSLISAKSHFELAHNLAEEGKIDKAIACYKYCLSLEPNYLNAYVRLAQLLEETGKTEEALFYYKKLAQIQTGVTSPDAHSRSRQQIRQLVLGKNPQAVPQLPGNNLPQISRAKAVKALPQSTVADSLSNAEKITRYRQQAKQEPNSPTVWLKLGNVYYSTGQWQEAIACYSQVIKLAPKEAKGYLNLGQAWTKAGDKIKANRAFYQGFSLEPEKISAENHLFLGNRLLEQRQIEPAISCYRRAITSKPNLLEAYWQLGKILLSGGKVQGAIACYEQALKIDPNCARSYFLLGNVFAQTKQLSATLKCYGKAAELEPNNAEIQHNLGETLSESRQWEAAIAAYSRAIANDSQNSWSYNNLGNALLKTQQWQAAADNFRKAIALKDNFFWSYQNLGEALFNLEQWSAAVNAYQKAIELNGDYVWSHYNLGEASSKLFRWREAISAYQKAIALKPDFAEAHAHLGDALAREEKWSEAVEYYERAIEINPGIDVAVYRNLKEALNRKKPHRSLLDEQQQIQEWPYNSTTTYQSPKTLPDGSPWPKISIVTPSYNQGRFIEETILSVINQNYPNLEYILIDGASDDETSEIIEKYRQHFSYAISEPDKGQSHAINKGFRQATGEILTWLNSDDRLAPGALYAVALAFYNSGADAVAGICQLYKDGVEIEQHLTSHPNDKISLEDILDLEGCWLQGKFFYQPEVMFTREIWEKAGGEVNETLYYSMDYEMWARFAAVGAKLQVIGVPVAQYRLHEEQKTSTVAKYHPELSQVRKSLQQRFNLDGTSVRQELPTKRRRSLKIAVFNDTGNLGGAGIANYRIAQALTLAGHQVFPVAGTLDWSLTPVDCQPEEVDRVIGSLNPDLLIIGNIHNFQYSVEILARLSAQYPTIFIMHDQWLFTGRCGYTGDCQQYTVLCDRLCPTWEQYPCLTPSKIAPAFKQKRALVEKNNLTVLTDSQWLKDWVKSASSLDSSRLDSQLEKIYYGLDLKIFRPQDSAYCRRQLGLPQNKFIILTGSQSLEDERKGFKYLLEALEFANLRDVLVLCFGHNTNLKTDTDIESIGYINNPELLAYYYSAADLFVSPAIEEAFGQTFIEAAACGTPAVGFAVGGVSEAINDGVSGRVVTPTSSMALADAIAELHEDPAQLKLLSQLAPWDVANRFSSIASYHSIISAWDKTGWLEELGMTAVSKFTPLDFAPNNYLTIRGGNWQNASEDNLTELPLKIVMDKFLQGSGWFPSEIVGGVPARWMERVGSIFIQSLHSASPLKLEITGIAAVDGQLLNNITVLLNGNLLETTVEYRAGGSWICQGIIPAEILAAESACLLTLETEGVRQLAPGDSRKASLLVQSLVIKSSGLR